MRMRKPKRGSPVHANSAFGWGPKGRWFKSSRPDLREPPQTRRFSHLGSRVNLSSHRGAPASPGDRVYLQSHRLAPRVPASRCKLCTEWCEGGEEEEG